MLGKKHHDKNNEFLESILFVSWSSRKDLEFDFVHFFSNFNTKYTNTGFLDVSGLIRYINCGYSSSSASLSIAQVATRSASSEFFVQRAASACDLSTGGSLAFWIWGRPWKSQGNIWIWRKYSYIGAPGPKWWNSPNKAWLQMIHWCTRASAQKLQLVFSTGKPRFSWSISNLDRIWFEYYTHSTI